MAKNQDYLDGFRDGIKFGESSNPYASINAKIVEMLKLPMTEVTKEIKRLSAKGDKITAGETFLMVKLGQGMGIIAQK